VVLVAIPFGKYQSLPAEFLAGRIVVDAMNYYSQRDGQIDLAGLTSSELVARHLPGARLVKAFNTMYFETLASAGKPGALEAERLALSHLVISPGPGRPENAGISEEAVRAFAGRVPVLGVCLGHQAIVSVFGGEVGPAQALVHGKATAVSHDGRGIFSGVEQGFAAGRYHSLAATSIPDCLEVSATAADGEVMAVRHRELRVDGVQFHPESVLTPLGHKLARNFLEGA